MRLAHEKGLLNQRDLNRIQNWALMHWIYLDKRTSNEAMRDSLELQCFNLFPARWEELYKGTPSSILAPPKEEDLEIPVDDIDEIERFYMSRHEQRWMSGAGAGGMGLPDAEEWGSWQ